MAADPARLAAYDVLRAVDTDDAYANLVLPRLLRERRITGRDAALATELVGGTLRGLGSYDAVLARLTHRPPDPGVRDALRLGAHQLLAMRVPTHAAVSTSVDVVRDRVGHKPAGFVNAVLRKVADRSLDEWLAGEPLHVRTSHPAWVVDALAEALDRPAELQALLAADNERPAVTLVARPGLTTVEELGGTTTISPLGRALDGGDPGEVPAVRKGRAGVQDAGSQLVALALTRVELSDRRTSDQGDRWSSSEGDRWSSSEGDRWSSSEGDRWSSNGDRWSSSSASPGEQARRDHPTVDVGHPERWLDLCAGPGGKAALLAAIGAQRGATLLANERQPHRAALVVRGVPGRVVVADGTQPPWPDASFDRVLVDAPCTGLGALRRRPEARWRRRPDDVAPLAALQRRLLTSALASVRPGGVVAYATCSPVVAETADVVRAVLGEHPDVTLHDATTLLPEAVDAESAHLPGALQLWPHRHRTDAMFLALLRR